MTRPRTDRDDPTVDGAEVSLFNPDAYAGGCPHERLTVLRNAAAVSWQGPTTDPGLANSELSGGWFVHRYAEVRDVLGDPTTFSSERGTAVLMDSDPDIVAAMANMLINMDPPGHGKYRKLVAATFTPRRVNELRPRVEQIASGVIDKIAHRAACDGVADIAAPMPMQVIAELLGIPEMHRQLFEISNRLVGAVDTTPEQRAADSTIAAAEIHSLGVELAAQKRDTPDSSLISAYVNGNLDGVEDYAGCTDEEAGWFLLLMAVAGNETVRTATSQALRVFAEFPAQRDLLVSDLERHIPGAVEELLRYRAPIRSLRRTATTDTQIDGTTVGEGDKVVCNFSSALRDERQFDKPEVFDITRPTPSIQLAFGYGEHYCLGANLARLQLRTILREIYSRIPDVHPVGPVVWQSTPLFEGLLHLPVEFTPES